MAKILESKKDFKLIECSMGETTKFGGMAICDSCNSSDFTGVVICVLNSWYCKKCFDDWHKRAIYYPEDSRTEERNFNRFKEILNPE